jgi:protein gp37
MKDTSIEWATSTFNAWWGCTKVSPGCTHCYAETLSNRYGKDVWGPGKERWRTSAKYWEGPLKWNQEAAQSGKSWRVFCNSMSDVFDSSAPDKWRSDLFGLIRRTPNLSWLILTKRLGEISKDLALPCNVWLGASVEDQRRADERIPDLIKVPAAIHFLSVEPLLEAVDLGDLHGIDWVIVGGESGRGYRPMDVEWALSVRDQCRNAGVRFFFKQMSGLKSGSMDGAPVDLRIQEFPTGGES